MTGYGEPYIASTDGPYLRRVQVARTAPDLWNAPPRLSPGRYRVTLEGEVKAGTPDVFMIDGSGSLPPSVVRNLPASFEKLRGPAPKWKPGDVVVVWFGDEDAKRYTYVRGEYSWPGDRGTTKNDAFFDQLWERERLTPVLQAGGKPFDEERLS